MKSHCSKLVQNVAKIALATALVSQSAQAFGPFGRMGGATSGGGDEVGLEVRSSLDFIVSGLQEKDSLTDIPAEVKTKILARAQSYPEILVVDEPLPARPGNVLQTGVAFSEFDGTTSHIRVNRARWSAIQDPAMTDAILFHELAVLADAETTGVYDFTSKFMAHRADFWNAIQDMPFVCTISLLKKDTSHERMLSMSNKQWQVVGSAVFVIDNPGSVGSDWVVVKAGKADKKGNAQGVVALAVISAGYLRLQFADATIIGVGHPVSVFDNLKNQSPERVYWDPYRAATQWNDSALIEWNGYQTQVACSKSAAVSPYKR